MLFEGAGEIGVDALGLGDALLASLLDQVVVGELQSGDDQE
jgi:hypothetical protein